MTDKFDEYLNDKSQSTRERALTSSSHKKVFQNENGSPLSNEKTNTELATYGDALLKCAFCKMLFDEGVSNITEGKKNYESDKVLVEVIARHYELLKYIRFDKNDDKIPQDYDYRKPQKGNDSLYKYIATAVEALVASFYLDNGEDFGLVIEIAKHWKRLIDNSKKEGFSTLCTT